MSYHKTTIVHWYDFDRWEQRSYVNDPHGNKHKHEYNYMLGLSEPHYPMPAIRYSIEYQIGDGDYWCGIYNLHLEEHNPMHDDCFVMLWNVYNDREYMEANRSHLFGVMD